MTTYAIGDVQGCYAPLARLLDDVHFDADSDRLWFVGDLVNRGPESLKVLRLVKSLGDGAITVLGNHDLHLLAVAEGVRKAARKDTLDAILEAPDRDALLDWLRRRPLAHHEDAFPYLMVHAGIPPQWSATDTLARAAEVEASLRGPGYRDFLHHMYGDQPDRWHDELHGLERLRVITNYLTRMRFCSADGTLDITNKRPPSEPNPGFAPWYSHPARRAVDTPIVFGHWAALAGNPGVPGIHALDTGCVWGGKLTAMRLEDATLFRCAC